MKSKGMSLMGVKCTPLFKHHQSRLNFAFFIIHLSIMILHEKIRNCFILSLAITLNVKTDDLAR